MAFFHLALRTFSKHKQDLCFERNTVVTECSNRNNIILLKENIFP